MLQLSILTPSLLLSTFDSLSLPSSSFSPSPSSPATCSVHIMHVCLSSSSVFGAHLKVPREVLSLSFPFSINSCSHDWEKDEKDGNRKERMRDRWEERSHRKENDARLTIKTRKRREEKERKRDENMLFLQLLSFASGRLHVFSQEKKDNINRKTRRDRQEKFSYLPEPGPGMSHTLYEE